MRMLTRKVRTIECRMVAYMLCLPVMVHCADRVGRNVIGSTMA